MILGRIILGRMERRRIDRYRMILGRMTRRRIILGRMIGGRIDRCRMIRHRMEVHFVHLAHAACPHPLLVPGPFSSSTTILFFGRRKHLVV